MSFQMNFKMITARKCSFTLVAVILFVPSVEFNVAIPTPLVLKQSAAVCAFEGKFVTMDLFVPFQVAETTERLFTELAWIRQPRSPFLFSYAEITPISYHLTG